MQAPLPLASYLFILRKHMWLVLGTVVAVLAGGWYYGHSMRPVYESSAEVVMNKANVVLPNQAVVLANENQFVNNNLYAIRTDEDLAVRVLEYLRKPLPAPAAAGEAPPAAEREGPPEPPRPDPSLFRDLDPRSLPAMVAVTQIPGTSIFRLTVRGPDREVNQAVANGYLKIFSEVFREGRQREYESWVRPRALRYAQLKKDLDEVHGRIEDFKGKHPQVSFDAGAVMVDKEIADATRKSLAEARVRLVAEENRLRNVENTLKAVALGLKDQGDSGYALLPPCVEDPTADPRLSERVQALDLVGLSPGVAKARAALDELEQQDSDLWKKQGLQENAPERRIVREKAAEQRRVLARATEAALVKLAQDVAESRRTAAQLEEEVGRFEKRSNEVNAARAGHERLQKRAEGIQQEIGLVQQLLLDAEVQKKGFEEGGGTVSIKRYASPREARLVAPNKPVIYLTVIVVALLLAGGLAYVLEYLDDTVKSREDFDRLVRLPFLGFVPHIREREPGVRDLVVARGKTGSPEVESFRAISTGIQFSRTDREVRTFLITSSGPGEGKTTVSVNVASAFASAKSRVLLIDADLRRARVHRALGVDNSRGLTNVLVGESALAEAVQRSAVEGLDVLASGPIPPNPAEALGSERMQEVLREAAARYDRVVVDSPPIVAVTDPALLAKYVDAVFLVISLGKTSIRTIQRGRETLATVGVSLHGAILNNADTLLSGYAAAYGGYGYGYGYAPAERPETPETPETRPVGAGKEA